MTEPLDRSRQPSPAWADDVVIIGAGPAGLTAAYQLVKAGKRSTVLEADSVVGGISRTVERDGWRFDIGGHRFFTKVQPVEELWHEILPDDDFMLRPRMSRILYRGKFYDYPLKASNALAQPRRRRSRCAACCPTCGPGCTRPADQDMYEGWLAARFGWRLYRHFFKTYTEQVWGHPPLRCPPTGPPSGSRTCRCRQPSSTPCCPSATRRSITSLIEEFEYPKLGPGMMWERCRELVEAAGTKVVLDTAVARIRDRWRPGRLGAWPRRRAAETEYPASAVISSMPLSALVKAIDPPPPAEVVQAAADLSYRDFLTVALVVPDRRPASRTTGSTSTTRGFRSVASRTSARGRRYMVKEGRTCLGPRVLRLRGRRDVDEADEALVAQAKTELGRLGLVDPGARGGRLRGAHAEGVPVLRRRLQGQRRGHPDLARGPRAPTCSRSDATGCTATTTRTTRCTRPC